MRNIFMMRIIIILNIYFEKSSSFFVAMRELANKFQSFVIGT